MKPTLAATFLLNAALFLCLLLTPGLTAQASADEMIIYTVPVRHRTPESLVDPLLPMIDSGGHLSVSGNKLIIRTTRANFEQLSLLIDELDTPVRQLLISVKTQRSGSTSAGGLQTRGNITRGTITVDGKPVEKQKAAGTVTVTRSSGWGTGESSYQLRAEEGERVFIQTGQEIPVQSRYGLVGGHVTTDQYKPVTSGFAVIARLRGEHVLLNLEQTNNTVNGNAIDTQTLYTQITARAGEWVQLGGVQSGSRNDQRGIVSRHSTSAQDDTLVWVKVDLF